MSTQLMAQAPGLRLYGPIGPAGSPMGTQMVDGQGNVVHTWAGANSPAISLLEDGSLIRSTVGPSTAIPGSTQTLERLSFDGTLLWDLQISDGVRAMHHDIEPMPNGNILVMTWDRQTAADALAAGRHPAYLSGPDWFPDSLIEVEPTGPTTFNIVWEWHMMDHIIQDYDPTKPNYGVVRDHPELLDLNYPVRVVADGDWNHGNGIDYDPINDWIVISFRLTSEIYLIDHSTTTAEASGHTGGRRGKGGDFLWRWGNPAAYRSGTIFDNWLRFQHDPRFIEPGRPGAGNITVFNNSYLPDQSAVHEIALPLDPSGNVMFDTLAGRFGPDFPTWTFTEQGFFSEFVSGAERLASGNTLICSGFENRMFEVTPGGQTVWSFVEPQSQFIFQAHNVDRTLWSRTDELSLSGGQLDFDLRVDSSHAGELHMLLGSISGTTPGTTLPGGVVLPLNPDFLMSAMSSQLNTGVFASTLNQVGTLGDGLSTILVPSGIIPPALTGLRMDFAEVVFDASLQAVLATNPTTVTITL